MRCSPRLRLCKLIGASAVFGVLGGCAGLTTSTKQVDLNEKAIAIDVKQRVIFSQRNKNGDLVTCAEPSPDALTVVAASGGISIDAGPGKPVGNASAAFAEQGAFVGLRTQAIQTMRDALFSLCTSFASGAVDKDQFTAMQRRFQSTLMGLIAIEQLTRPVTAAQAVLTSNSAATAGAGAGDAAVDRAVEAENSAIQARLDAEKNADSARDAARQANEDVRAQQQVVAKEKDPDAKKSAQAELDRLVDVARGKQNDARDMQRRLDAAQTAEAKASQAVRAAKSRASAAAGGSGGMTETAYVSLRASRAVANTVDEVVKEVNRSYSKDACFDLIARFTANADAYRSYVESLSRKSDSTWNENPIIGTMRMCTHLLEAEVNANRDKSQLAVLRLRAKLAGMTSGPGITDDGDDDQTGPDEPKKQVASDAPVEKTTVARASTKHTKAP
jgi:hypothetical protein